jgi:hypothetical protein
LVPRGSYERECDPFAIVQNNSIIEIGYFFTFIGVAHKLLWILSGFGAGVWLVKRSRTVISKSDHSLQCPGFWRCPTVLPATDSR